MQLQKHQVMHSSCMSRILVESCAAWRVLFLLLHAVLFEMVMHSWSTNDTCNQLCALCPHRGADVTQRLSLLPQVTTAALAVSVCAVQVLKASHVWLLMRKVCFNITLTYTVFIYMHVFFTGIYWQIAQCTRKIRPFRVHCKCHPLQNWVSKLGMFKAVMWCQPASTLLVHEILVRLAKA